MSEAVGVARRASSRGVARRRPAQLRVRHLRRAGDGAGVRRRRVGVAGHAAAGAHGRGWRRCSPAPCRWGSARFSARAPRSDWYERERQREESEVGKIPHLEREELRDIYRKKGLEGEMLERVLDAFTGEREALGRHHDGRGAGAVSPSRSRRGRRGSWSARRMSWRRRCRCSLLLLRRRARRCWRRWRSRRWRCSRVGFVKARLTQRPELRAGIETMMTGLVGTAICWGIGRAVAHVVGGGAGGVGGMP